MRKLLIALRSLTCLKTILTLNSLLFSFLLASGQQQPPSILWSKSFGGTNADKANAVIKAYDGGLLIVGSSKSNDGDVSGHHGTSTTNDGWLVKISENGDLEWQRSYGGTGEDVFKNIIYTNDGNYLIVGNTASNDGDVSGNHGLTDNWIVKIDRSGNILWQKCLGGSQTETTGNVRLNADGSFYLIGGTNSNDGDVFGYHGPFPRKDIWVAKLSSEGVITKQKAFGGTLDDEGFDIAEAANGSFIIACVLQSGDGDFVVSLANPPNGYIIKVDSMNTRVWHHHTQRSTPIQVMPKGDRYYTNYDLLACVPANNNFGASHRRFFDNHGGTGTPLHTNIASYTSFCNSTISHIDGYQTLGATGVDVVNDDDVVFAGASDDTFQVAGFHGGSYDGFIAGSQIGNFQTSIIKWRKLIGGSGWDQLISMKSLNEYEFVAAGLSNSNNGDVSGNHGDFDFWIVKMGKVNLIKGSLFEDYDANGTKDPNEPYLNNIVVESKKDANSSASTSVNNIFRNQVDTGTYVTKVLTKILYHNIVPASINSQFTTYYNSDSISFAVQPIPGQRDYKISLIGITAIRPGFDAGFLLKCQNLGTDTLTNKKVKLIKDSRLQFVSATPAETSMTGDTIEWSIASLAPRQTTSILVNLIVAQPPVVNNFDTLVSVAYVDSIGDVAPSNNKSRLRQPVTGSFDPNDKNETKGGELYKSEYDQGEFLNYTIRFQNTGNDTAFSIVVRDTIENRLDITSLEMVQASHPYQFTLKDGKFATWTFSNIKLPDSNINEPLSHGYIVYKIKPVVGLAIGDSIRNSASIYFDFNLPVNTNTNLTIIKSNPLAPPVQPALSGLSSNYCGTIGVQQGKVSNMPLTGSGTTVEIKLDDVVLVVGADSSFAFNVSTLSSGSHAITAKFTNAAGSKTTTHNFFVTEAVLPEVNVSANITTILNLASPVVITASNAVGGGVSPKYTFAKDRSFNTILQAEGNSNIYNLDPSTLTVGENWIYVRMKTSETCYILQTNTDSIKLIRDQSTGIIDPDNPNRIINVYPNPFDQEILINGLSTGKTYSINLYNSYGQLMFKQRVVRRSSTNLNRIVLPGGIYLLSIFDEEKKVLLGTVKISKK